MGHVIPISYTPLPLLSRPRKESRTVPAITKRDDPILPFKVTNSEGRPALHVNRRDFFFLVGKEREALVKYLVPGAAQFAFSLAEQSLAHFPG